MQEVMSESVEALMAEDTWGEHPIHTRNDWIAMVAAGDTQLGYWNWLDHTLERLALERLTDESYDHTLYLDENDALGG